MLATLVSGKADLGDVFFLIGAVLAVVAALVHYRPLSVPGALLSAAVACIALGLLVL